jgi:SAM-dependent methyltransferase
MSYASFSRFYDAVQGDGSDRAAVVRGLIERHHPSARTVLELACGTGSILAHLRSQYDVAGLDRSPEMLSLAAEKLPDVRLIEGDMTQFALEERFDVLLCVYDSINHLLEFAAWEAVFDRVREHLADDGIFVFDINTEERLARLAAHPPVAQWFDDRNLLVMDVRDEGGGGGVTWALDVFEHEGEDRYTRHGDEIAEASFPREWIERALRARFAGVSVEGADRLYFTAAARTLSA